MSGVYFYSGHGMDMCDKDGNLIIEEVPKDCIYVTIAICGVTARYNSQRLKDITTPGTLDIFKNPVKNKKFIARLLGVGETEIHIHLPGETFVNNLFQPVLYLEPNDGSIKMSLSGIISDEDIRTKTIDDSLLKLTTYDITGVPIPEFLKYFQGAPTTESVTSKITKATLEANKITLPEIIKVGESLSADVSNIMRLLPPGVHYNTVCRSTDSCKKSSVLVRRATSASRQRTWKNTLERMVAHKEDYDAIKSFLQDNGEDLKNNIEPNDIRNIIFRWVPEPTVRQLLEDFKASITKPVSSSSSVSPAETVKPVSSSSVSPAETVKPVTSSSSSSSSSAEPIQASPIIRAVWMRDRKLVKTLLDIGADPNEEDSHGNSALDYAKTQKSPEIYDILIKSMRKGGRKTRRRKLTRRTRKRT
jgi:hypothetical protein